MQTVLPAPAPSRRALPLQPTGPLHRLWTEGAVALFALPCVACSSFVLLLRLGIVLLLFFPPPSARFLCLAAIAQQFGQRFLKLS